MFIRCPFVEGKGKHINKISRKPQENAGIIRDNPAIKKNVCFLVDGRLPALINLNLRDTDHYLHILQLSNDSAHVAHVGVGDGRLIRADFREGDEDSNFSVFEVQRFTEWSGPLH